MEDASTMMPEDCTKAITAADARVRLFIIYERGRLYLDRHDYFGSIWYPGVFSCISEWLLDDRRHDVSRPTGYILVNEYSEEG